MGLGFSKDFVIFLILSIILGFATENPKAGLSLMITYVIVKVVWRILT